ncbi:unnamed protein product [Phaedon cochleariae]|uniref:Metalloendopeptidase n=1 Tax=Phaedon cochleariae TaxID=80249 RepID=A0A9N9X2G8_PHACE|nr:unnamed protein product [Phaedon cochleariae]
MKSLVLFCVLHLVFGAAIVGKNNTARSGHSKYTIDELLLLSIPKKTSDDIDLDPCKADIYIGDIAIPLSEHQIFQEHGNGLDSMLDATLAEKTGQKESEYSENHIIWKGDSRKKIILEDGQPKKLEDKPDYRDGAVSETNKKSPAHARSTRAVTARKERVWEYGVIPYEIDGNFSGMHKVLFKQAMKHWEDHTCIKFVERDADDHPNYIIFTERPCGCCSFVGRRGNGGQAISIGKNCDKFGIIVHELGHVVGLWHEHTRPDRDKHVNIIWRNIMGGQEDNFNKLNEDEVNSLGLRYDYDSIMHYARNTFSKGIYLDTIRPIEMPDGKRPEIGQRVKLSEGDIAQTNLLYKCRKCGRTFQSVSANFTSPVYLTNPLDGPVHCEWRITAAHGEKIVLNISNIDIKKSVGCKTDYVEVRDGYWHRSPVLGIFCGSGLFHHLISSSSRMLITYVSANPEGRLGFDASYEIVCGGDFLIDSVGHLESPNYPEEYQPNKECVWRLAVPENYQVALQFQSFDLENHDGCIYDYVEIRDGQKFDSPVIAIQCGHKLPADVISSSNSMLIKFASDGWVQKGGFSATVMKEFDECSKIDHGCEQQCVNTLGSYVCTCLIGYELHSDGKSCEAACGGVLDTPNGTITSPSFPDCYPKSKHCVWQIVAQPQHRITVNFTHFDLEGNINGGQRDRCEYDRVEVHSFHSQLKKGKLRTHGSYCGPRSPGLITSEGNVLRIEFYSDVTVQKTGFAAVFFTDMDECAAGNGGCQHECLNTLGSYTCNCYNGYTLHANGRDCKEGGCKHDIATHSGNLTTPNYPDNYPPKKECVWHLTTTPGHRVSIEFHFFELEPHQECSYDHVDFYDGPSMEYPSLGVYCGSKLPPLIVGSRNELFISFKSDSSTQKRGFLAAHSTVCGGTMLATLEKQPIYSHAKFGSSSYDNRADCDWTVEAGEGYDVKLSFLTFDVEGEKDCGYDFVEVFSGLDSSGPSLGKYCGSKEPFDIVSSQGEVLIRFSTDDTVVSKGFSLLYEAVENSFSEERYD